jgi:putative transposase
MFDVSEGRVLRVTGWPRTTHRHKSRVKDQTPLRMRLRDLALARPRYGYRRLSILLRREGWHVNAKRVYRLYREEGLTVRIKRRKKFASHSRVRPAAAAQVNDRRSMDFVSDSLSDGRKIRVLTVIDSFTRECLALKIARNLPSSAVTGELDVVIAKRGAPKTIQVDNGTEFTSNHFDAWAYLREIDVDFIRPGKPVDNAHIESFNGRLRDECLNSRWLESVDDARQTLQAWPRDYNEVRPHSSLGDLPPAAFAAQIQGVARELR